MTRAIDAILSTRWAITSEAMRQLCSISLRQNDLAAAREEINAVLKRREEGPAAVSARLGQPLKGTRRVFVRNNVAILPLTGPIFPRANMMTEMSGATSLSVFSADFHAAIDDRDVKAVIIDIDSPGGVAFGPAEMAEQIRTASRIKPVVAYVSGMAASAAYWIASAASEIVTHESGVLGSIGVVTAMPVQEQPDQNGDVYHEIVSSNARNKRPDPRTDEGRAEIVRELDELEDIFIASVARYRNVTVDTVISDFGKGGVFAGAEAARIGMADRTGDFESLLQELSSGRGHGASVHRTNSKKQETKNMTLTIESVKADHPDIAKALIDEGKQAGMAEGLESGKKEGRAAGLEEGRKAERDRLAAIDDIARPGFEKIVAEAKADGKSTAADVALTMAKAEKSRGADHLSTIKAETDNMPSIDPSASNAPAAKAEEDPSLTVEDRAKAAWNKDEKIRKEFSSLDAYTAFLRAEETGRIRLYKKNG